MPRRTRPGSERSPIDPYDGRDVTPDEFDDVDGLYVWSDSLEQRPEDDGFGDDGAGKGCRHDRSKPVVVDPKSYL